MANKFNLTDKAKWVKGRDSLNNLVDKGGTVKGIVSGMTSQTVAALNSASDMADTFSKLGLSGSGLSATMQIDRVTAVPLGADKAITLTEIGPQVFLPIRQKSRPLSWQTPYTMHVDRFLKAGATAATSAAIAVNGDAVELDMSGRPVKIRVPVPAAKVYVLSIVSSAPSSDEGTIGTFGSVTGFSATQLRHANDTKKFTTDTGTTLWHDITITEFRAIQPVDGWKVHLVKAGNKVHEIDLKLV
jgi:hypothetical protein